MKALDIGCGRGDFLSARDQIERLGRRIDHGRAFDANRADDIEVIRSGDVGDWDGRDTGGGIGEVYRPKHGILVGIKRVHRIIHGAYVENVTGSSRGGDIRKIEGLGENGSIYWITVEFAETGGIDISGREHRFTGVRRSPGIVVSIGKDADLRGCGEYR